LEPEWTESEAVMSKSEMVWEAAVKTKLVKSEPESKILAGV